MKSLNPSPESSRRSGVMDPGLTPGHGPTIVSIRVSYRHNQFEVGVPSNSTFGKNNAMFASHLKSVISQSLGLKPETCKLFFGGIEKQDHESLQTAGVGNNSEVLLVEDTACGKQVPEEVPETSVPSKGEEAVAKVREEVDKLEQQVTALQAVIDSGKKVDDKEIVYLTEMLMRELLKLDGIEAEGGGKVRRKTEVRRIQLIVETLDTLKSRNSNPSTNTPKTEPAAPEWTAFESSPPSVPPVATSSPSSAPSPSPAPPVQPSPSAHPIMPSSLSSSSPSHMPSPAHHIIPSSSPSHMPSSIYPAPYPYLTPPNMPDQNFPGGPYPPPSPMPYFIPSAHHPYQYYDPSQMAYFSPYPVSSPAPPAHGPAPYHDGSSHVHHPSNPFAMPSTTVTQNWEHFG